MQMAIDAAGFTRPRPTSFARPWARSAPPARMERLRARLYAGHGRAGHHGTGRRRDLGQLAAFANFGFPESHSVSFAYLVY